MKAKLRDNAIEEESLHAIGMNKKKQREREVMRACLEKRWAIEI